MSEQLAIPGPKVLLLGGGGTGKSHSLSTLQKAGLEVACLFTEPSGMETLSDYTTPETFHWMYLPPATVSFDRQEKAAKLINSLSFKSLTELGDIDKSSFPQWMQFLNACANFKCQRCGKEVGALDKLGGGWAVALDSLSGLNVMAMNNVVGLKPVRNVADWGVAMDTVERYVTAYCTGIQCLAVITGHLERETDPNTGQSTFQASTLGQKLAPKISRFFSDIIMSKREVTKFTWTTGQMGVDLKARNVPISENLQPDFGPIVKKWHARIGYTGAAK